MTVTRVALDWGFEHLSQFARDYRGVYGETPSATLRRTRPGHEPRRVSGD
jgi:AraC family ethanolamine operon transcriptional activator